MADNRFVKGADAMLAALAALRDRPAEFAAAQYQETEIEATECKKICPVWNSDRPVPENVVPGALRDSIHAEGPDRDGKTIRTYVVAGGPSAPYGLIVHEDLDAFHKVGEAKFISRTLDASAPHMAERVVARIEKNRGGR